MFQEIVVLGLSCDVGVEVGLVSGVQSGLEGGGSEGVASYSFISYFIPQLTYADIVVFTFLNSYFLKGNAEGIPEQLKNYPTLSAWYELVRTQPKVLQWLKNSPPDLVGYIY